MNNLHHLETADTQPTPKVSDDSLWRDHTDIIGFPPIQDEVVAAPEAPATFSEPRQVNPQAEQQQQMDEPVPIGTEDFYGVLYDTFINPDDPTGEPIYKKRVGVTSPPPERKKLLSFTLDKYDDGWVEGGFHGQEEHVADFVSRTITGEPQAAPPHLPDPNQYLGQHSQFPGHPALNGAVQYIPHTGYAGYGPAQIPYEYVQPSLVPPQGIPPTTTDTSPATPEKTTQPNLQSLSAKNPTQQAGEYTPREPFVFNTLRNKAFRRWAAFVIGTAALADAIPAAGNWALSSNHNVNLNPIHSAYVYKKGFKTATWMFR
jgi:hypothetical protein